MKIAILGVGNVGGTLGRAFAKAGHTIFFGVPDPKDQKNQKLIESIGSGVSVGTVAEAGQFAEIIIATPWNVTEAALKSAGNLSGKIVVDCTDPLKDDLSGLSLGHTSSGAEQVEGWATGAKVRKAFNRRGLRIWQIPSSSPAMPSCLFVEMMTRVGK